MRPPSVATSLPIQMRFKYSTESVGSHRPHEDRRLDNFIEYWSVVALFMFHEFTLGLECHRALIENPTWLYTRSPVSKSTTTKTVV